MQRNYRKILSVIVLAIFFLVGITPLYQYPVKAVEIVKRWHEYHVMNDTSKDINAIGFLQDEDNAWYTRYMFICHGGVDSMA